MNLVSEELTPEEKQVLYFVIGHTARKLRRKFQPVLQKIRLLSSTWML